MGQDYLTVYKLFQELSEPVRLQAKRVMMRLMGAR